MADKKKKNANEMIKSAKEFAITPRPSKTYVETSMSPKVVQQKGPKPRPKRSQNKKTISGQFLNLLKGMVDDASETSPITMEKGGKVVNQKGPKPRPTSGMMNEMMGRMIDPNTEISDEEAARLLRMARMAKRGKNYAEGGEVNRDLGGFILDSYLGGVRQKDLRPQKIGSPPAKKSSSGATMPGRGGKFKGTK
jgi:hypothetical protein